MELLSLTISGFRSFVEESVWRFPPGGGLFLLRGDNQAEPELGSNGAGKSTLGDALCWCLSGKTSRGLRGSPIDSWDGKGQTIVEVEVMHRGEQLSILRTRNPNDLRLNGDPVTQEELEQTLGFSYAFFLHTCLLGQYGIYFLDLTPAKKLELISQILGLDQWTALSTQAGKRAREHQEALYEAEKDLARIDGRLESLRRELQKARREHRKWKQELTETLKKEAEEDDLASTLQDLKDQLQENSRQTVKAKKKLASTRKHKESLKEKKEEVYGILARLTTQEQHLTFHLQKLEEKEGILLEDNCPACTRPLTPQTTRKLAKAFTKTRREGEEEREGIRERKEACKKDLRTLKDQEEKAESQERKEERELYTLEQTHKNLTDVKLKTNREKKEKEREREERGRERSPYLSGIREVKGEIGREKERREEGRRSRGSLQKEHSLVKFWQRGFQELRLWLITRAMEQLELECNSYLVELGLRSWHIRFSAERETQSGTISKGFNVDIESPASKGEPVPWEGWSGGESQRLRIAAEAGLANLIRSQKTLQFSFEFWDEPTNHLSKEGIDDLLRFFADRAKVEGRQVWVVDHRSLHSGQFDGMRAVVKDRARGSYLVSGAEKRDR